LVNPFEVINIQNSTVFFYGQFCCAHGLDQIF
jgi:hypothetical protein